MVEAAAPCRVGKGEFQMRRFVLLLALAAAPVSQVLASSFFHDARPLGDAQLDAEAAKSAWVDFQSLQKAIPARLPDRPFGRFTSRSGELLLASDGRAAMYFRGGDDEPESAWLGRHVADGEWLQFELHQAAVAPEAFDGWWSKVGAERMAWQAEMEAWRKAREPMLRSLLLALESDSADALAALAEIDPDEFPPEYVEDLSNQDDESRQTLIDALKAQLDVSESPAASEHAAALPNQAGRLKGVSMRLLPTPHGDGWLLIDQDSVESMVNSLNQYGRAYLSPKYWNDTPSPEEKIEHGWRPLNFKTPLPANLPAAITGLLLNVPRLVSVTEWLDDPAEPDWKAHMAELRVHVDLGSQAGARVGMGIHGIAPDERWHATLVEVNEGSAIASLKLNRFSPWESVELPTRGLRFSTRSPNANSDSCGFDSSAAVKARVTEVIDPERIEWDADGFGFVRLRIDQGRSQGLIPGDRLSPEDYSLARGEGRVESVDSQQAVVLWRMQRFSATMSVEPPVAGVSLVTPAWRREAYSGFSR